MHEHRLLSISFLIWKRLPQNLSDHVSTYRGSCVAIGPVFPYLSSCRLLRKSNGQAQILRTSHGNVPTLENESWRCRATIWQLHMALDDGETTYSNLIAG